MLHISWWTFTRQTLWRQSHVSISFSDQDTIFDQTSFLMIFFDSNDRTRAAESESEPESESVGVGCFSRSRSRSRQNLPTSTDSRQTLIPDSQKSPCRLFRPFFAQMFVVDWLDDKYRSKPCAVLHSRDGNRSKFRTQTQPGPDIWNVSFCSGRGIIPFCNRVWALDLFEQ